MAAPTRTGPTGPTWPAGPAKPQVGRTLSKAEKRGASGPSGPPVKKAAGGEGFPTDDIPPHPVRSLRIPFERAHMLATLPRSRLSELVTASFIGFLASLPGGWDGLHQAFFKIPREPLALYSFLEMSVSLALLILTVSGLFARIGHQTSLQYLASLYDANPGATPGWKDWWAARPRIINRKVSSPPVPALPDTPAKT